MSSKMKELDTLIGGWMKHLTTHDAQIQGGNFDQSLNYNYRSGKDHPVYTCIMQCFIIS